MSKRNKVVVVLKYDKVQREILKIQAWKSSHNVQKPLELVCSVSVRQASTQHRGMLYYANAQHTIYMCLIFSSVLCIHKNYI